jgi:hypothetical protein
LNDGLEEDKSIIEIQGAKINCYQYSENLFNTTMALDLLQSLKTSGLKPTILKGNVIRGILILGKSVTEVLDQLKDFISVKDEKIKPETENNK